MENVKKISLNEILEKLKEGKKLEDCGIIVREYVPLAEKVLAIEGFENIDKDIKIDGMVNSSMKVEYGLMKRDYVQTEMAWIVNIIELYSNVDLIIDDEETIIFDAIMQNDIYDYVKNLIPTDEYSWLWYYFQETLDSKIELANSFQALLVEFFDELKKLVPSERKLKGMLKKVENFDASKLKSIQDLFEFATKK